MTVKKKKPIKRIRKTSARQHGPSENEIHMKCAKWLADTYPSLLAFHVANERKASVQFHMKLKRLGLLDGVADWLVFPPGPRKIAIELKDGEGVQTEGQKKFQKRWERAGGDYYLVRTLEDFQAIVMFA